LDRVTAFTRTLRTDLVVAPPDDRPPLAVGMEWVSRITTVALEMVLPGLAGLWLDRKLGTVFLTMLGFAVGLVLGTWHLVAWTRPPANRPPPPASDTPQNPPT
jgi:hypothetical protein